MLARRPRQPPAGPPSRRTPAGWPGRGRCGRFLSCSPASAGGWPGPSPSGRPAGHLGGRKRFRQVPGPGGHHLPLPASPEPHPVMVGTPAALSWAGPSNPTMEPAQGLSLLAAKALEASTGLLVCGSRGQQPLGSSSRASCLSPAPSPVQGCTNCSQAGDGLCPPGEPRALVSDPGPVPARQEERP